MQVLNKVFTDKAATGTSNVVLALGAAYVTAEVVVTGTSPSCDIQLEGSLDGTTWNVITSASGVTSSTFLHKTEIHVYQYYQLNITAISGTLPKVNAWIAAIGPAAASYAYEPSLIPDFTVMTQEEFQEYIKNKGE